MQQELDRLKNLIAKAAAKGHSREMRMVKIIHRQKKPLLGELSKIKIDPTAFLKVLEDRGTTPEAFLRKLICHSSWLEARGKGKPVSMNMLREICDELDCSPYELIPQDEADNIEKYKKEFAKIVLMYMFGVPWPKINRVRKAPNSKGLCRNLWLFFCYGKSWDDFNKQYQRNKVQPKKYVPKPNKEKLKECFFQIYQLRLKRLSWQDISERMDLNARYFFTKHKKKFMKKAEKEFGQWYCELCKLPIPIDDNANKRFCDNKLCIAYRKKYGNQLVPDRPVFW